MIHFRDVKIKKWDPKLILHSLENAAAGLAFLRSIGVGPTQLTLDDKAFTNLKTVKILLGAVGVTGCDYNFATANDVVEQPIDFGHVIPALARVIDIKTHTEVAFAHAPTAILKRSIDTDVATITTAAPHGLVSTNSVVISGMVHDIYNGTFTATRVSDTVFTYPLTHANDAEDPTDIAGVVTFAACTFVAETGNVTSGNQFIASTTVKALDAITAMANAAALNIAPNAAATHVWVSATPLGKWNHITAGRLAVYITYLEA
jgi:hypothetical protein